MTQTVSKRGPDLPTLIGLFPKRQELPAYSLVGGNELSEPYKKLLVHTNHMTVTVEAFHGDRVNVRVLESRRDADWYARRILLTLRQSGRVVQFGIVRVHLAACPPAVRAEILSEKTPIGRVLIEHNVLRRIEPTAYLRVEPGAVTRSWFGDGESRATYGRLGIIYCDHQPAVELLEIVAPCS